MTWDNRPERGDEHWDEAERLDVEAALAGLSQTHSDADQTASDSDAATHASDQDASLADQTGADADQEAADADQRAADREVAAQPNSTGAQANERAAARVARAVGARSREVSSAARADTELERARTQADRFETAVIRDEVAAERDRIADLRDGAAVKADRARLAGNTDNTELRAAISRHAELRDLSRDHRQRAAADRARAAEDRIHAVAAQRQARIEIQRAKLDGQSGVFARDLGHATLTNEIDRCRRAGDGFVLAHIALDNVDPAHEIADEVISAFVDALRERLRSHDPVVRVEYDEFLCGMPATTAIAARQCILDVRNVIEHADPPGLLSLGIAVLEPNDTLASLALRAATKLREDRARRA
jgi:GGDEF domain-containing protein